MEKYLTVLGESIAEYTEKRSKFIATLRHCESEAEAVAFIDEMRSKYWDAKHNVFAYSINKGNSRFSDDGEPHGTAGKPILDVINGNNVTDIAIVVTRYFGGVLLGTGGLVRAYSKSARDALDCGDLAEMIPCNILETECEYTDYQKLVSLIENSNGKLENSEYTDKVLVTYSLKAEDVQPFFEKLEESFSARLKAKITEEKILPIKIEKNM